MKILHLANWNSTNIGNGALIFGTERLMREDAEGKTIEFIPEAWDDYTFKLKKFDESFVELVNAHDALLVNGAVTANAFRRNTKETGMRFNLPLRLWKHIQVPIIFYGISYRCWPLQEYPNKKAFREMLSYALENNKIFFGVRNDGTKEWIRTRFGVDSSKIIEIPDPGLFVPTQDLTYPELHPTRKNVIIAFNNEDAVYRYARGFGKVLLALANRVMKDPTRVERIIANLGFHIKERTRVVKELVIAVEKIAQAHDAQFILVPHYLDDYGMMDEFISRVQERIAHQRIVSTGLVSVPHTSYFYGRYKKADLALSMRVHSMSPSIGLGIPVIPITSQGRMRNFLKKAGLSDIAIDVSEAHFGTAIADKASSLLSEPSTFLAKTSGAVVRMREEVKGANKKIFGLLGN